MAFFSFFIAFFFKCGGDPLSRHESRLHGTCSSRGDVCPCLLMGEQQSWWGLPKKIERKKADEVGLAGEDWEQRGEQERKRSEDPLTLIPLGSGMILIYFASPCFELFSSIFSHLWIPLTFGDHLCILLPVLEYSECRLVIAFDFLGSCPCFSFSST